MKNNKPKELLLILHSDFYSKQWAKNNDADATDWFTQKEQLKAACRNGLSSNNIPDCLVNEFENIDKPASRIFQINDANTFIDLVFCKHTQKLEKQYSLNPYVFMEVQVLN